MFPVSAAIGDLDAPGAGRQMRNGAACRAAGSDDDDRAVLGIAKSSARDLSSPSLGIVADQATIIIPDVLTRPPPRRFHRAHRDTVRRRSCGMVTFTPLTQARAGCNSLAEVFRLTSNGTKTHRCRTPAGPNSACRGKGMAYGSPVCRKPRLIRSGKKTFHYLVSSGNPDEKGVVFNSKRPFRMKTTRDAVAHEHLVECWASSRHDLLCHGQHSAFLRWIGRH